MEHFVAECSLLTELKSRHFQRILMLAIVNMFGRTL